jgi:hypothetical protein
MDDNIPPKVKTRPAFRKLSPDEEEAFLREQAEYEAAYRRTGQTLALWEALKHVHREGQTVPDWLMLNSFEPLVTTATTGEKGERYRERWRHVQRYRCVRDLRRAGHTKDDALDQAVVKLKGTPEGGVSRGTIEESYDTVRRSLKRAGRESEFFFFVDDDDPEKSG